MGSDERPSGNGEGRPETGVGERPAAVPGEGKPPAAGTPPPEAEGKVSPTPDVSIFGHPVAGVLPLTFLSAGWTLLALQIAPWIRDQWARSLLLGEIPSPAIVLAMPPSMFLLALICGGLLLIGLATFIIWIRSAGGMGPLCDRLLRRNEALAAIVLLTSGVLTVAMISMGSPPTAAMPHIARGWLWHEYLRAGALPLWTDLWSGGFPADQHGPPLAHILQALTGFFRLDQLTSAKEVAWFSRMVGGVGFALLCARLHRDQRAGFLGGVLYALAPTFHAAWMWEGRLPGMVVLGLLPWALLAAERVATGAGAVRAGAFLALLGGALVMANGEQARLAILLIGTVLILRGVTTLATRGARSPSIGGIVVGLVGGAALAACFLYPMVREAGFVNGPPPLSLLGLDFRLPSLAGLTDALRWNGSGKSYVGLSIALLAALGFFRAVLDRKEEGRGIGPIPLAILILLPWFIVSTWRQGLDLGLIGAQIAAAGAVRRGLRPARLPALRKGVLPLAFLLVLVDMAPINLSTTYGPLRATQEPAYAKLLDRLGSGRFLELSTVPGALSAGYRSYAGAEPIASVGGPSLSETPRAFVHTAAMIDTVAHAIARNDSLGRGLVELLAFHNVRYVLITTGRRMKAPQGIAADGAAVDPEIPALRIENAAPVTILEPGSPPGPATPAIVMSAADSPPRIPPGMAREAIAWLAAAHPRPVPDARAVVLPNRLRIELPDLGPVTIRIARNSFPRTEVLVDDQAWPWREGPLGGIVLDLQRGAHKIEVRGTEDKIRRGCRYAQWGLAALLFLVAISPHRR
jgi:hypothetical protein